MKAIMVPLHGLWVGLAERDEFRPLRDWLTLSFDLDLNFASTMAAVPDVLAGSPPPDIVIIGESWPDEFHAEDVTRLLTVAPLARTVCITGAWSEAIGRTRSHWPPAWRVPLWEAIPRLERELAALAACRTGAPDFAADFPPWTASRQETWQWQTSTALRSHPSAATVCLGEIADPSLVAELAAQCNSAGFTVVATLADVVVLDAEPWCATVRNRIESAIAHHPHSTPLAITGWNLPQLRSELATLGVCHVADKLSPQSFIRLIQHILPSRDRQGASSVVRPREELAP